MLSMPRSGRADKKPGKGLRKGKILRFPGICYYPTETGDEEAKEKPNVKCEGRKMIEKGRSELTNKPEKDTKIPRDKGKRFRRRGKKSGGGHTHWAKNK